MYYPRKSREKRSISWPTRKRLSLSIISLRVTNLSEHNLWKAFAHDPRRQFHVFVYNSGCSMLGSDVESERADVALQDKRRHARDANFPSTLWATWHHVDDKIWHCVYSVVLMRQKTEAKLYGARNYELALNITHWNVMEMFKTLRRTMLRWQLEIRS